MLQVEHLTISYGTKNVLNDICLSFPRGSMTAVIGRNGSGKSTLLKAASRAIRPTSGDILLDGVSIYRQNTRQLARRLAILSQGARSPEDYTVRRLACCGRYPYAGFGGRLTEKDFRIAEQAMEDAGVLELADRPLDTLSGGERQRAWIAMLLTQEPEIMLLDEPTTYLDIGCQYDTLELVRRLNREKGITILMVLHDLNQAARYSGRMVAVKNHRIYADGSPEAVLTREMIAEVFGVNARVLADGGAPYFLPNE